MESDRSGKLARRRWAEPATMTGRWRRVLALVCLTAALGVAAGIAFVVRDADASDAVDADRVSKLDQTLRNALVAGDAPTVRSVLAPRFELIDPSGDRQSRDTYLESVSSGDLVYDAFDPVTPVAVRVSGNVAVVTYESRLKVSAGTLHLQHMTWHTHVYQQTGGRWQQVWSQATAVGGFPPPGS